MVGRTCVVSPTISDARVSPGSRAEPGHFLCASSKIFGIQKWTILGSRAAVRKGFHLKLTPLPESLLLPGDRPRPIYSSQKVSSFGNRGVELGERPRQGVAARLAEPPGWRYMLAAGHEGSREK
jgi:hypothetical protein